MKPTEDTKVNARNSTKTLGLIIIFAALAIALNMYGPKIPFPLADFLYFQLWEIPIVIAFLLLGPKIGVAVAGLNTVVLFFVFQGGLPMGPVYNLAAVLSMMLGIYIPYKIATRKCKSENLATTLKKHAALITVSATLLGVTLRVAIMSVINFFALQQVYPFGYQLPEVVALAYIPPIAVFNAIVAAYTIPIAIAVAIAVLSRVKID
jgi:riboflavin transporter FmnP